MMLVALVQEGSLYNFCCPILVLGLSVDIVLKECSCILKELDEVIVQFPTTSSVTQCL